MSCIQLSTQHIAAVAHGLAFILNGAGGMCHLAASHELPELYDALSICRYPHDFLVDDRKVYAVLYRLNEAAYEGRYNVEPGSADEFPAMPQTFPHLLHLLDYNDGRYTIDPDFYAFAKLLNSFIYQCNEDATRNNPVLKALSGTSRALYAFIVQNAAEYNNAEWII